MKKEIYIKTEPGGVDYIWYDLDKEELVVVDYKATWQYYLVGWINLHNHLVFLLISL
jgi:hypothetical protein